MTPSRMQLPEADSELWALVEAVVDRSAGAAQCDLLEARLGAEPEARWFYVAYLELHAHLQWRTRGESAKPKDTPKQQPQEQEAAPAAVPVGSGTSARRPPWRRFLRPSPWAVAAALALAIGLATAALIHRHGPDDEETVEVPAAPAGSVAVLIDTRNTVWDDDMVLPTAAGSALPPGRLKLRAGVVEIAFNGGGEVLLEGPADFDLNTSDRGFLHRGKLTAKVAEGALPFRVSMPGVVVTGLGGECGLLQEESGLAEIHVFKGRVGTDPTDKEAQLLLGSRMLENTGVLFDAAHHTMITVPLNEQAFAALRPQIRATGATVRDGPYAGQNFATATGLLVKNSISGYSWETFLRFDLARVKGNVNKATVRLMPVKLGQPLVNAAAFVPDNRWAETTITWDTKPTSGEAFVSWTAELEKAVEFDVTGLVQQALAGDKQLSLRIFAPQLTRGNSYVQYGSRKGGFEARPELRLTMSP
jgi:hypothetical protein